MNIKKLKYAAWLCGWTLWVSAVLGVLGRLTWAGVCIGFILLIGSGWFDIPLEEKDEGKQNEEKH